MPLEAQTRLLRVLQQGEYTPVGGRTPIKTNVRIVAATNRDLAQQVQEGRFREDLYYRLNVFPIEMPSLRERREDLVPLVEHFIRRFNAEEGKSVPGVTPETMAMITSYDWPGNVRQLENAVFRAIVLSDGGALKPDDFPQISGLAPATAGIAAPAAAIADAADQPVTITDDAGELRTLEQIERDLIQYAIDHYSGHMSEVARRLGIGRSTLYRKVREYDLRVREGEELDEVG
jgi:DNA-binding NtrC family response regulator